MAVLFRQKITWAWIILFAVFGSLHGVYAVTPADGDALPLAAWARLREALQHALHLRFPQALALAADLAGDEQTALEAALGQGMIAYFQARWQTRPIPVPARPGAEFFTTLLAQGQPQLDKTPRDIRLKLLLGTASIFVAMWPPEAAPNALSTLASGRQWLQQVLLTDGSVGDAHFGLGLAYFVTHTRPPWEQLLSQLQDNVSPDEALRHLQRAAATGHFSQDIARTFLLRLYELEHRYPEAIALGQELQTTFADNGYYALLTGRSQYAYGQYAASLTTLSRLATAVALTPAILAHRDDRFDLYYILGQASLESADYDAAFQAFRQALNVDPAAQKDESLWAKYHVATLYERRGEVKTARQMYQTLLRGRNVGTLHQQIHQRLAHMP